MPSSDHDLAAMHAQVKQYWQPGTESDSLRLAVEEQREATLKNWTTGEQVETQCSVYVLSVGSGGQREKRWKDTKNWTTERVAHISYIQSTDLNPWSMYHKLIL